MRPSVTGVVYVIKSRPQKPPRRGALVETLTIGTVTIAPEGKATDKGLGSVSTNVEIALVGPDLTPDLAEALVMGAASPALHEPASNVAWDDRQRVSLVADDDELLFDLFDRAIAAAGVHEADWSRYEHREDRLPFGTYRFMALRDEDSPIPLVFRLTQRPVLVDEQGLAVWGRGLYPPTTYRDIYSAAEAGTLHGDPTQVYLRIQLAPAGGEAFVEWELLHQIWQVGWQVAAALAIASDVHSLYGKVRDRFGGRRVVESKSDEWLRRNGFPDLFREMLRGEPWDPFLLAASLGCTTTEAEAILELYGYDREAPRRWVYVAGDVGLGLPVMDLSARVVKAYTNEARGRFAASDPDAELETLLTEILNQAIANGDITGLQSDENLRRYGRPD